MEDIDHLELTQSLLKFYRSRIHDLQRDQSKSILDRLKMVELSTQTRKTLECQLLEYQVELEKRQLDLGHARDELIRERRAIIELAEENSQLRGHVLENKF